MSTLIRPVRAWALAAFLGTGFTAAGIVLFHRERVARASERLRHTLRMAELTATVSQLGSYDEAHLDRTRARARTRRAQAAAPGAWEALRAAFEPQWSAVLGPTRSAAGVAEGEAIFRLRSVPIEEWPQILKALRTIEDQAGIRILEVAVRAGGNQDHRSFDEVRIGCVVSLRTGPAASAP